MKLIRTTGKPRGNPRFTCHDILTISGWNGIQRGDRIVLKDDKGKRMTGRFVFQSYKVNISSGRAWIDVFGGKASQQWLFSVGLHRVSKS